MYVELIEVLRCPGPHAEARLVVSASVTDARHIMDGVLGCPVCGAEFVIAGGIARVGTPRRTTQSQPPSAEIAMRLAAFLELTDARGFGVLCGRWGAQLDGVRRLAETPIVLVNPPSDFAGDPAGVFLCGDAVPFAAGSLRAAALDADMPESLIASVVRAVRLGGRVLGPVACPLPAAVTELVRDDRLWVGEKEGALDAAPRLVGLTRGVPQVDS